MRAIILCVLLGMVFCVTHRGIYSQQSSFSSKPPMAITGLPEYNPPLLMETTPSEGEAELVGNPANAAGLVEALSDQMTDLKVTLNDVKSYLGSKTQ